MGRGRTHHHVAKQKSEDQSRRPIIAMDYFFTKMESIPSAQVISEELITCIAVKEDRHHNIMSSVALKKGVEECWTIERVAKFIDLLGYREITLKSDTGLAIIAFKNRVAEMCKAEVTIEDPDATRVVTTDPMNRMNPRYQYGIWLGMRNNSAECFIGNADGVFRAREIRRLESQDRWDTEAINTVIEYRGG